VSSASGLVALIVDDNAYARAMLAANLRALGISSITEARGGAQAVGLLLRERFDLLVTDWHMEEVNGAGLIAIVRTPGFPLNGAVPVVVLTAHASRENIVRARELGAEEILVKPFTAERLKSALDHVLPAATRAGNDGETVLL
jgi:CheY-like chemotaxis protein